MYGEFECSFQHHTETSHVSSFSVVSVGRKQLLDMNQRKLKLVCENGFIEIKQHDSPYTPYTY